MTCITLALLKEVDERLKKRLEDSTVLLDHLVDEAGENFLLATTEKKTEFEGVNPIQMEFRERANEELIALISGQAVDFSQVAFRIYADPFNTKSLVSDSRIGDGFIVKAGRVFDSPEDNLRLLRAIGDGTRVQSVHRKSGEQSAIMDERLFLARCGAYHPSPEEILRPFGTRAKKGALLHVLSIGLKNGKITVDNTSKTSTVRMEGPPRGP
jgi:fructose 1,6-bisphosphatase